MAELNLEGDGGGTGDPKEPVKLIKRVKTAHSFLRSVSDQFHVVVLSLPV